MLPLFTYTDLIDIASSVTMSTYIHIKYDVQLLIHSLI